MRNLFDNFVFTLFSLASLVCSILALRAAGRISEHGGEILCQLSVLSIVISGALFVISGIRLAQRIIEKDLS